MSWVGHNPDPEVIADYGRTLPQHISDRVNVIAKLMAARPAGRSTRRRSTISTSKTGCRFWLYH